MTLPMTLRSTLRPTALLLCCTLATAASALAADPDPVHVTTARVLATGTLWLAGMPDGATDSGGDVAPDNSPLLVTGLDLTLGGHLRFTDVRGGANNTPDCPPNCVGPDGYGFQSHDVGSNNGIPDLRAPINSLIGVFLGPQRPDLAPPPAMLNFERLGLNFSSLSPHLKQVFFIGDGLNARGFVQQFDVPEGATRLFLGTHDGTEWNNNSGEFSLRISQFDVPAVPEPGSLVLMLTGLGAVTLAARRRSGRS
jgi:hypothetical protein